MRPVTIVDVAEKARISVSTVSRVLKDDPRVSPEVRERVKAVIEKLGYTPSVAARRMGGSKSYLLISLNDRRLTVDNWRSGRGNDWLDQMLHGAMLTCQDAGYHFMFELVDLESDQLEQQILALTASLGPDGVIVTPPISDNEKVLVVLRKRQVPVVRIGSHTPGQGLRVYMDDHAAARDVTRYLLRLGHRRIGFIAGSYRFLSSVQRVETFRRTMAEAGLEERWIQKGDFTFESGLAAAQTLLALDARPTALMASNDEMALAALHVAQMNGVAVPDQLSLISFDDGPSMRLSIPALTAVRQPTSEMASKAAQLLIEASAAGGKLGKSEHVVPFELVERASCAPPPAAVSVAAQPSARRR
jgi:LacI family transcriptional regulator